MRLEQQGIKHSQTCQILLLEPIFIKVVLAFLCSQFLGLVDIMVLTGLFSFLVDESIQKGDEKLFTTVMVNASLVEGWYHLRALRYAVVCPLVKNTLLKPATLEIQLLRRKRACNYRKFYILSSG